MLPLFQLGLAPGRRKRILETAGREPRMPPPQDESARHVPAPRRGPGRNADVARCLGVLHSVVAHSFLAGLVLANVRTGVCREAAVSVDHALGQLDEIAARHGRWQPSSPSARTTSVPRRMPNARARLLTRERVRRDRNSPVAVSRAALGQVRPGNGTSKPAAELRSRVSARIGMARLADELASGVFEAGQVPAVVADVDRQA
jgi:hypothetical protein